MVVYILSFAWWHKRRDDKVDVRDQEEDRDRERGADGGVPGLRRAVDGEGV